MRLSDKLKSIFTSGDDYTVLQLLNKMIEEIKNYETSVDNSGQKFLEVVASSQEVQQYHSVTFNFDEKVDLSRPIVIAKYDPEYDLWRAVYTNIGGFDGRLITGWTLGSLRLGDNAEDQYIELVSEDNLSAGDKFVAIYYELDSKYNLFYDV